MTQEQTTPQPMPEEVCLYLSIATCLLLPGTAKQVSRELHGHLHQDMVDGLCAGLTQTEAWQQAMQGAGPAWRTALGLGRVHTLGLVVRILLLSGALGGASVAVQASYVNTPSAQVGLP